jgi:hypothetical protein
LFTNENKMQGCKLAPECLWWAYPTPP